MKPAFGSEITSVFGTLDQSVETFIAFEKSLSASINNVAICFVTHRGFVTAMLSFLLLIICTFVGKPYLLFWVRDYTYKITTTIEYKKPKKEIKHETAIYLKTNIFYVGKRMQELFPLVKDCILTMRIVASTILRMHIVSWYLAYSINDYE